MRIRMLKSIASIYGGFAPGMVVDIPNEAVAKSWCNAGIAEETKEELSAEARQIIPQKVTKAPQEKPEVIPTGMFWCDKHNALHRLASAQGIKCNKRQVKEAEEVAGAEVEAEAKKAAEEEEARVAAEAEEAKLAEEGSGEEEPEPEPPAENE